MNISFPFYVFAWALVFIFLSCEKEPIYNDFATLSGVVYDYHAYANDGSLEIMDEVEVRLIVNDEVLMTSETGSFSFQTLKTGENYTLQPEKQEDILLGISSTDIELFENYLEGTVDLSIGQKVAADMNRDLILNGTDLQIIEECIQTPMMAYCLDYRFFHEDCQSLSQRNRINEITFTNLSEDHLEIKIFAIKSGDLATE